MDTSYQRGPNNKDEWLTPPAIINTLAPFDLDPCSPIVPPWKIADRTFTVNDDGLRQEWFGRVWCNPPYGKETAKWLRKCAEHGNAIALIFNRTETAMFFDYVWNAADAVFFIEGRLTFYHVNGASANSPAGSGSVLIAYGKNNVESLRNAGIRGKLIELSK